MLSLKGKVAIVTGAGSVGPGWGNGKATAVLLARQGAKVFGLDNNPAAVEETIGIIKSEGGEATAHVCDVLDSESFQAAVEACIARYGQLDIMVNNVGGSHPGGAESMPEEVWDRQVDFNLKSAFLGCKFALPHLKKRPCRCACRCVGPDGRAKALMRSITRTRCLVLFKVECSKLSATNPWQA